MVQGQMLPPAAAGGRPSLYPQATLWEDLPLVITVGLGHAVEAESPQPPHVGCPEQPPPLMVARAAAASSRGGRIFFSFTIELIL